MLENLPRRVKTLSVFLAGFMFFSFIITSYSHYTVGQEICELSEGLEATGPDAAEIMSSENSCPSLFERWMRALSAPSSQPILSMLSVLGGLLSSGIYWHREKAK